MRAVLERIWKDIKNFRMAILLLIVYNVIVRMVFHAFCPQLILTGFPCAGCGMTRAMWYIITGRLARGMKLNPAAPLWMILMCWFFINRYIKGVYRKSTTLLLGIVCMVTFVIYVYRMLHCFPGDPPMVYYRNNILRRIGKVFL